VLTMLYDRVFVCWTHGQTPGLSGHHHNGYLLSFFFFLWGRGSSGRVKGKLYRGWTKKMGDTREAM
jgi:hypothetical protein